MKRYNMKAEYNSVGCYDDVVPVESAAGEWIKFADYEAATEAAKATGTALQAPVREVPGWQPIETAPKAGREVLLWLPAPYSRIAKARWFDLWENWQEGEFPSDNDEYCGIGSKLPTHYMPLPAAPVQQDGDKP